MDQKPLAWEDDSTKNNFIEIIYVSAVSDLGVNDFSTDDIKTQ